MSTINDVKTLVLRIYGSQFLQLDDMSWYNQNEVDFEKGYDYAFFRHTYNLSTQEEIVDLLLIAKNVPEIALHNNRVLWLVINHYKLK